MNINLTLIGQVGTFLVFWWFVNKFIWPIFSSIATERQRKIADGLSMADKARFTVTAAEEESAEMISKAKQQANEIINKATKQANELVDQAREDAKKTGSLELAQARDQIEQEKRQTRDQLRAQVATLVIEGTEKVLGREISAKDHDQLLQELTEKF